MYKQRSLLIIATFIWAGFRAALPAHSAPAMATTAELRSLLSSQLGEHVVLAASATNAALHGRDAEFKAAAEALDANSVALSKSIGSVYGTDAENAFLPLWRTHIGFFVDYTQGVAAKDQAKQDQAVSDLTQYTQDFGAFLNAANPNLPKEAVADLVKTHVLTLKDVVDAQASGDQAKAYTALRTSFAHMDMIASPLAGAISQQFPNQFMGAADSAAANLRTTLNLGLQEHVVLAASATNAALHGRDAEFKAAAEALDANSVALSKSIGSVYGTDAENAFLPLWRTHIGFFVDYTQGVAAKDQAKQDQALADLTQYAQDFGAFLNSANPNLTKDAVASLLAPHVTTLTSVIDAQATDDYATAYSALRDAYAHMSMIADPLTNAIVQQFPEQFGGATAGATATGDMANMPAMMPNTGAEPLLPYALLVLALALVIGGLGLSRRYRRSV